MKLKGNCFHPFQIWGFHSFALQFLDKMNLGFLLSLQLQNFNRNTSQYIVKTISLTLDTLICMNKLRCCGNEIVDGMMKVLFKQNYDLWECGSLILFRYMHEWNIG